MQGVRDGDDSGFCRFTVKFPGTDFSLEEFTRTSTGLPNQPTTDEIRRLYLVALYLWQPVRERFGKTIITSGYRSKAVNAAVGGVETSDHRLATAADGIPATVLTGQLGQMDVFEWIVRKSRLRFGQAICEYEDDPVTGRAKRWIHLSLPSPWKENQEALIYEQGHYRPY